MAAAPETLPVQLTSFVGRSRELTELGRLLADSRLLTLTGVGGVGKTRLALQLAERARPRHRDGACFVDLAPLNDGRLLPQALAGPLGVLEQPERPLVETLLDDLATREPLLVLDNCEHLLEDCASLVDQALRASPQLTVVATSREPLEIPGEQTWGVPPLAAADARALFLDRVRRSVPDFEPTPEALERVDALCARLDGIPLALELAAVRLRTMGLDDLLARLDESFELLTGPRTAVARQRTLRATIDWSYELLSEEERVLFRRLAVFVGGFDLSAAEAVCAGEPLERDAVALLLLRLVERSMVVATGGRYRLLDTLRQYGRERLMESGEAGVFERRHAEHYLELAEEADRRSQSPEQIGWLRQLADEHDNLRAALAWFGFADADRALGLATALGWFWSYRGHFGEGRNALRSALERAPERTPTRARALARFSALAFMQADYDAAVALADEAVAIRAETGSPAGDALAMRGLALTGVGDFDAARQSYEEALRVTAEAGHAWGVAAAQHHLAIVALQQGDVLTARPLVAESAQALRELDGGFYAAQAILSDAILARLEEDVERAEAGFRESLALSRAVGNRFGIPMALDGLAGGAAGAGKPERALRLAGAAASLRDAVGLKMPPFWPHLVEAWLAPAHEALAPAAARAHFERGRAMRLDEAVAYALEEGEAEDRGELTARELEIAGLVAEGLTNKEIAARLHVSVRTAEGHVENIRSKLGFRTRSQIAAWMAERQVNPV